MRVMAQIAMVMNLDKCIGCHTCSVTCKQAWTNRGGMEYAWFNNVETRPGQGYPRRYEDQDRWQGGWTRTKRGKLTLRAGGRWKKLSQIFSNPELPNITDYYEPWTYDLMAKAPGVFQVHVLIAFALFALFPFTRLVHALSAPVGYLFRPYIVYRSRDAKSLGGRPARRGWERVQ